MQQLDVNTDEAFRSFLPGQKQEDDKALIPEFYVEKKLMGAKSQAAGRQVYEDREYVRIIIKGQQHGVPVHEVNEDIRRRFPNAYAAFRAGLPSPVVGTPIEQLPGMGPTQAHQLKALNLRTIEDVANISDENVMQRIGLGGRDLVKRCQAWVANTNERTAVLEQENKDLRKILAEMNERMAAIEAKPKAAKRKKKRAAPAEPQA